MNSLVLECGPARAAAPPSSELRLSRPGDRPRAVTLHEQRGGSVSSDTVFERLDTRG
jgi:hypothetical protein